MKMIYFADFRRLTSECGRGFIGIKLVDEYGIWPEVADDDNSMVRSGLTDEEIYQIYERPDGWLPGEPLLKFPCTLDKLREILDLTGNWGWDEGESTGSILSEYEGSPRIYVAIEAATEIELSGKKRRTDELSAVIKLACKEALDPDDWPSVWAALVALAEKDDRPAPLMGYVEGEGIKYKKDGEEHGIGYLTRDNFRQRCGRRKRAKCC